jgi:hypothetical protein
VSSGGQAPRDRVAPHPGIAARQQVVEQSGQARQTPLDRASRESRFTIIEPDDRVAVARKALRFYELQDVRRSDTSGLLHDYAEEDLEIVGDRQEGIRPCSRGNELQITIKERMTESY